MLNSRKLGIGVLLAIGIGIVQPEGVHIIEETAEFGGEHAGNVGSAGAAGVVGISEELSGPSLKHMEQKKLLIESSSCSLAKSVRRYWIRRILRAISYDTT